MKIRMNIVLTRLSLFYVNFSQLILVFIISMDIMMSSNNSRKLLMSLTENRQTCYVTLTAKYDHILFKIILMTTSIESSSCPLETAFQAPKPLKASISFCLKTLTCLARTLIRKKYQTPSVP